MAGRILITGVAGFIGSHLADRLLSMGNRVFGLDNFDGFYPRELKESNIREAKLNPAFTFHEGDIRDSVFLDWLFSEAKPDIVIHLAARAGVRPSIENPLGYFDVNVNGSISIMEAMRKHGVIRLIHASSSSVYGNNEKVPYAENDRVDFPISPYAASKKSAELIAYTYHHLYAMSIVNLRFFTVYGPRQRPDLAIRKFFTAAYAGQSIPVYGDGSTSRDYTYIDDIVNGICSAVDYVSGQSPVYETCNLGNSNPVTLARLLELIHEVSGRTLVIDRKPMQPGDVRSTFADTTRAGQLLGYEPRVSIRDGLERFNEWYLKHHL